LIGDVLAAISLNDCSADPLVGQIGGRFALVDDEGKAVHRDKPERQMASAVLLLLARVGCSGRGGAIPLRPDNSDVNLFGFCKSVVDLNAEITHRALNLFLCLNRSCTARRLPVRR
jgi:hypothetical protein